MLKVATTDFAGVEAVGVMASPEVRELFKRRIAEEWGSVRAFTSGVGLSRSMVVDFLAGRRDVRTSTLMRICRELNLTIGFN